MGHVSYKLTTLFYLWPYIIYLATIMTGIVKACCVGMSKNLVFILFSSSRHFLSGLGFSFC